MRSDRFSSRICPASLALLLCCLPHDRAFSGVVLDGSFGKSGSLKGPNYLINADMGKQVGGNLFHSFSQLDLVKGEAATFTPAGSTGPIQNVLARVTGGTSSSIDGVLRSEISGANLFLINPAGVAFGPNAQLDISGAFTVSTAEYVKLSDGGKFNARLGGDDLLTSAPVSAFGFVKPKPVSFVGSNQDWPTPGDPSLQIPAGKSFSVIAGDISLNGQTIQGTGSRVNLVSVGAAGEAGLSVKDSRDYVDTSSFATLGNISFSNHSQIDTSGPTGGGIQIQAENLTLDTGRIRSETNGPTDGEPIEITARDSVFVRDSARAQDDPNFTSGIRTSTDGASAAGDVRISARLIQLSGGGTITSPSLGNATETARGGNILLRCTRLNIFDEFSIVDVDTFGLGAGGQIDVQAKHLDFEGTGDFTGLIAETGNIDKLIPTGRGGDITVNAEDIYLANGGQLATTILGSGDSGNIKVKADSIFLDQGGAIFAQSDHFASGRAGDISLTANSLEIHGGSISARTLTCGAGGDIRIDAGSILLTESGLITTETFPSPYGAPDGGNGGHIQISSGAMTLKDSSISAASYSSGNAGSISVAIAGKLDLGQGGSISSTTYDLGSGGSVNVKARDISISGASAKITAESADDFGGDAGKVTVVASNSLDLEGGGEISSTTFGGGNGGSVIVSAETLRIAGFSADGQTSQIAADSFVLGGGGNAGNVGVTCVGKLDIEDGGAISSSTFGMGQGGSVNVSAHDIILRGGPFYSSGVFALSASESLGGDAGNVAVKASNRLQLENGGVISATTDGLGKAGNVQATAQDVAIVGDFSGVFSRSLSSGMGGAAGTVTIAAHKSLSIDAGGEISSSTFGTGNGGNVSLSAENISIHGGGQIPHEGGVLASSNSATQGGVAGNVSIHAKQAVTLDKGGKVSTNAVSSNAGDVTLSAGWEITLLDHSSISSSAGRNGGNITLQCGSKLYLVDSGITATAGSLHTGNISGGIGGNITIDPIFVVLNHSHISANAAAGRGGAILIDSDYFFNSQSPITATGAQAGTVEITSPPLDLSTGLVELSNSLVDVSTRLQERCTMALQGDFSSFISLGRGGVASPPDEELLSFQFLPINLKDHRP